MEKRINKKLMITAFISYLIVFIWVIVFKFNASWIEEVRIYELSQPYLERIELEWIPFYTVINQFKEGNYFDLDHLLNIIIYIPIGLYLKFITKLNNKKIILIIILSSLIFEIEQSITCIGGLDGTDLVTNFIGGLIGLYSFKIINKFKIKYINWINISLLIVSLPLAIYAIINTIINFDLYIL